MSRMPAITQVKVVNNFETLQLQGKNPVLAIDKSKQDPQLFIYSYDRDNVIERITQCFKKIISLILCFFGKITFEPSAIQTLKNRILSADASQKWHEGDYNPLVKYCEGQINQGITITLTPKKKAPTLPRPIPNLSNYCCDLTLQAEKGELRPLFGREVEIRKIAEILGRNQKSNPILLGPPGVGKTSVPEGIAQRIVLNEDNLHSILGGKGSFFFSGTALQPEQPIQIQ